MTEKFRQLPGRNDSSYLPAKRVENPNLPTTSVVREIVIKGRDDMLATLEGARTVASQAGLDVDIPFPRRELMDTIQDFSLFLTNHLNQVVRAIPSTQLLTDPDSEKRSLARKAIVECYAPENTSDIRKYLPGSIQRRTRPLSVFGEDSHFRNHYLDLLRRLDEQARYSEEQLKAYDSTVETTISSMERTVGGFLTNSSLARTERARAEEAEKLAQEGIDRLYSNMRRGLFIPTMVSEETGKAITKNLNSLIVQLRSGKRASEAELTAAVLGSGYLSLSSQANSISLTREALLKCAAIANFSFSFVLDCYLSDVERVIDAIGIMLEKKFRLLVGSIQDRRNNSLQQLSLLRQQEEQDLVAEGGINERSALPATSN